jgi:cell wall-associated NlpC family hydrolase
MKIRLLLGVEGGQARFSNIQYSKVMRYWKHSVFQAIKAVCLFLTLWGPVGCSGPEVIPGTPAKDDLRISRMGYTIQLGAFSVVENAARLTRNLGKQGVDAFHFRDRDRLFKVRFGNYPTRDAAIQAAAGLREGGLIDEYYIVAPDEYQALKEKESDPMRLREEIVRSAGRFLGVPYLWGGTSVETGFDCSGLAMTAYRLNGICLPRTSAAQFHAGYPISLSDIEKGDLLFFRTTSSGRISHVGIYAGDGLFIHAPRSGKTIGFESVFSNYYYPRIAGARRYL